MSNLGEAFRDMGDALRDLGGAFFDITKTFRRIRNQAAHVHEEESGD